MSFDDLFILPNEDIEQSGGHEPFTILKYTGSDTLTKRPEIELTMPCILVKKDSTAATVDTLEGYEAATGLGEGDILAINGDAFLQILENQRMGGGLEKHLFFNPNNAAVLPIDKIIGEQVIFLATFHQLHFLASINQLGVPALNTPINERFDALKQLLGKEMLTKTAFGIPHADMSKYFTEIQTNYVGGDDVRARSFIDICDLIEGEPTGIIKYFHDAVSHIKSLSQVKNGESTYTGTNTLHGFNSLSIAQGSQAPTPGIKKASEPAANEHGTIPKGPAIINGNNENNNASVVTLGNNGEGPPVPRGPAIVEASGPITSRTTGNNTAARTAVREGAEGKEAEHEENNGSASGSASSGNPKSVASSAKSREEGEGKEGEGEGKEGEEGEGEASVLPVNARLRPNATVPAPDGKKPVSPPVLPVTHTTRKSPRLNPHPLIGPLTVGVTGVNNNDEEQTPKPKPKRGTRGKKRGKKASVENARAATGNSTAAVRGIPAVNPNEEEVVSDDENEGYATTAAIAPARKKSVGIRRTSEAINTSGSRSIVATSKKGK